MERGEFSPCGTHTDLDSREPFDLQHGARMFYNAQDMLLRRKLEEQTDLQEALELQNRRLMGLRLLDVKNQHQRGFSSGSPIPSPASSPTFYGQSLVLPQFQSNQGAPQVTHLQSPIAENCSSPMPAISVIVVEKQTASTASSAGKELSDTEENGRDKESPQCEGAWSTTFPIVLLHLPRDNSAFPNAVVEKDGSVSASSANNNWILSTLLSANSALDMPSFNCQIPGYLSGQGTIGMYAGTGGPTCPVGI
ncbi:zinc finger CCCH domain-containing protein 53-like isoform X2 [Hibiscus syriacus]|uniref:Zinc finger CCCH domain-containing protein 53-like isoform X2 n=1 Tax=Hibiscus syriacus TaxID=106335 RepID=A0A6A3AFM2_HIBSY|nr:zinc finger CCCH domain-containing protein 53-like isoform X2 [Hibiscus syriacus]